LGKRTERFEDAFTLAGGTIGAAAAAAIIWHVFEAPWVRR
jgi:hypothetical protein